jgi:hypothetical protein
MNNVLVLGSALMAMGMMMAMVMRGYIRQAAPVKVRK